MKAGSFALAVTVSTVCIAAGNLLGAPEEQAPEQEGVPPIEQLLDRVDQLEARVRELESRQPMVAVPYARLDQPVPTGQSPYRPPVPLAQRALPAEVPQPPNGQGQTTPRGWRPFEFNGHTYYIVPLHSLRPAAPESEAVR